MTPLRLVIDASVASGADDRSPRQTTRVACADFLFAVRDLGHLAVFNDRLREEWEGHGRTHGAASDFALSWLTSMQSKGRVRRSSLERPDLRWRIPNAAGHHEDVKTMEDDFHLIEAALDTDRRVASRDDKARTAFKQASAKGLVELAPVLWVNPASPSEAAIGWLEQGAPDEPARRLS